MGKPERLKCAVRVCPLSQNYLRNQPVYSACSRSMEGQYANRVSRPYLQFLAIRPKYYRYLRRSTSHCSSTIQLSIKSTLKSLLQADCQNTFSTAGWSWEIAGGVIRRADSRKTVLVGGKPAKITGFVTGRTDNNGDPVIYWTQPGWDYNPGKVTYKPDLKKYDPDIAELFKKEEARRLELPKVEPLLNRFPVNKIADLEPLLLQYHNENPGVFLNGFKDKINQIKSISHGNRLLRHYLDFWSQKSIRCSRKAFDISFKNQLQ